MRAPLLSPGDPSNTRLNRNQSEYERERGRMVTPQDMALREARERAANQRAEQRLRKAMKENTKGMPLCDEWGEALA